MMFRIEIKAYENIRKWIKQIKKSYSTINRKTEYEPKGDSDIP